MKCVPLRFLAALTVALLSAWPATAQPKAGDMAPDFPIGLFSDEESYRLSDFRGKVVVLFFYENQCPRCKGSVPERNEIVKAFEGKPVKFIAVGASDTVDAVVGYGRETKLRMPIFADNLGLMEARYGQKISLKNIWQFRVIGPGGEIVGYEMDKATIEKALEKATWKYDPKDYDPKLKSALEALEWGQWDDGLKALAPLRRSTSKPVAESANKLYDVLKKEADEWRAEADKVAEAEPVKAYDLYARIALHFPTEPAFKDVPEVKRKLALNKAVAAELNARKSYTQLRTVITTATPEQKAQVLQQSQAFLKKFKGTPTADKVALLIDELKN